MSETNNTIKVTTLPTSLKFQIYILNEYGTEGIKPTKIYAIMKQNFVNWEISGEPIPVTYSFEKRIAKNLANTFNEREKVINRCGLCQLNKPISTIFNSSISITAINQNKEELAKIYCPNIDLLKPIDYSKSLICKNNDHSNTQSYFYFDELDIEYNEETRRELHELFHRTATI